MQINYRRPLIFNSFFSLSKNLYLICYQDLLLSTNEIEILLINKFRPRLQSASSHSSSLNGSLNHPKNDPSSSLIDACEKMKRSATQLDFPHPSQTPPPFKHNTSE